MTKVKTKDDTTLKLPDEQTITGVRDECQDRKRYGHVHNNAFIKKINGERKWYHEFKGSIWLRMKGITDNSILLSQPVKL